MGNWMCPSSPSLAKNDTDTKHVSIANNPTIKYFRQKIKPNNTQFSCDRHMSVCPIKSVDLRSNRMENVQLSANPSGIKNWHTTSIRVSACLVFDGLRRMNKGQNMDA